MPIYYKGDNTPSTIQYLLGPPQNIFGTEAERDTYATNNPDWLAEYDNNPSYAVKAGNAFYTRVDGAWQDATFLIGVAGDSEILSNVSTWNYPVKQPDGTFADGELTLNPLTKEVSTPATFRTGVSAGLKLKDTHAISSVGENIAFSNLVSNLSFTVGAWSVATFGEEWRPTTRIGGDSFVEQVLQPVFDTQIVNPDFISPAISNRRTFGFYYKGASARNNCKIEILQNDKEIFESKLFNIAAGDGYISFRVVDGGSGFVDLLNGVDYRVIFSSTEGDITLLGNDQGVPYLALDYQEWEDKANIFQEEVDNPPHMSAIVTGTNFLIDITETVINFTQVINNNEVTLNNGVFTVQKEGIYEGQLTVSIDSTLASTVHFWVERFVGGSWQVVQSSLASLRNLFDTSSSIQLSTGIALQQGQSFRIKGLRVGGGLTNLVSNTLNVGGGTITQPAASVSFKRTRKLP